jgi:two-component system sensor histidine kinase KdpD
MDGIRGYSIALYVVAFATAVGLLLRSRLNPIDIAMLFLLGVVVVSTQCRQGPALLAAALTIAAFDFLFVPPFYTFSVDDADYVVTFAVMLIVAVVMGGLTTRIREQSEEVRARARRTEALYQMSHALSGGLDPDQLMGVAARHVGALVGGRAEIRPGDPPAEAGPLDPGRAAEGVALDVAVEWVRSHRDAAGWGTARCTTAEALVLPLRSADRVAGVVIVYPDDPATELPAEDLRTALALADQVAVAVERAALATRSREAQLEVQSERLRTALLSSLSHDLRSPLGAIEGAASSLVQDDGTLPLELRRELAQTTLDESRRMTRLVGNLLEMVRVESGTLAVRKAWQPLEESLGVALLRLEERLADHPVTVSLPADLPLVPIDELLVEQVLLNLLENAAKHTPPGTPILVRAWPADDTVIVEVADAGPGIRDGDDEAVFEKFYRGRGASDGASPGAGLGLTICRGIIQAHGGRIWVDRAARGAALRFSLPLEGGSPDLPPEPFDD